MPRLVVTTQNKTELILEGSEGQSMMEVIRNAGVDELLAMCGGCCSCATCHVYVDTDGLAELPPMSQDEDELLDCSAHRQHNSRLSCQIKLTAVSDGLKVTIAEPD